MVVRPGPVIFVNIGWMQAYKGPDNDPTIGGHGYLKTHSFGHEAWNFEPIKHRVYGYVPRSARINLIRLGGRQNDSFVDGITVVWLARDPRDNRTKVVGWYLEATVHQDSEHIVFARSEEVEVAYQIEAPAASVTLLAADQRWLNAPTAKVRGNMGQSPVWYGNPDFTARVLRYIAEVQAERSRQGRPPRVPRQSDPEARLLIEQAAVRHATRYYESVEGGSRQVESVELDRVGWDLTATVGEDVLKVEVKGLSGSQLCVELTPNEYEKMHLKEHRSQYVIYVVTEANSPREKSHVFYYNAELSTSDDQVWITREGRRLLIQELTGARLTIA